MPRVTKNMLKCVFYLYGLNPKTGKMSKIPGATGFFVCHHSESLGHLWHIYAVTNAHAVNPYSCIRLNTKEGGTKLLEFEPTDWRFSKTDDLAMIDVTDHLGFVPESLKFQFDFNWIHELDLLWQNDPGGRAAVGDQTIMIGLFSDHAGAGKINLPVARFGNLAAYARPEVPVSCGPGDKFARPAFLNDMRSRTGFSGSPVWAWYNPYSDVDTGEIDRRDFGRSVFTSNLGQGGLPFMRRASLCLIGVHRAQFREDAQVLTSSKPLSSKPADTIEIASSMTIVVPAWEIKTMLADDQLKIQRNQRDERPDRIKTQAFLERLFRSQEISPPGG